MTRGENFMKQGRCKNNHCSAMLSSIWCSLISKSGTLKLHDKCTDPIYNCQKIITFTPHQYMVEGGSIKFKQKSKFGGKKSLG